MDVATCEFPSASSSGSSTDGGHASLDYGQFMAFLEREDGQITCLHQGTVFLLNIKKKSMTRLTAIKMT